MKLDEYKEEVKAQCDLRKAKLDMKDPCWKKYCDDGYPAAQAVKSELMKAGRYSLQ